MYTLRNESYKKKLTGKQLNIFWQEQTNLQLKERNHQLLHSFTLIKQSCFKDKRFQGECSVDIIYIFHYWTVCQMPRAVTTDYPLTLRFGGCTWCCCSSSCLCTPAMFPAPAAVAPPSCLSWSYPTCFGPPRSESTVTHLFILIFVSNVQNNI